MTAEVLMTLFPLKLSISKLLAMTLSGLLVAMPTAAAQDKGKADLDKIPKKVMDALKARFPNPVIQHWTEEKEGGVVLYDIEFRQAGRKLEADIKADGMIDNWEGETSVKDLPAAVMKAVRTKYRNATLNEAMAITEVKGGKEVPGGYEILLETADKKEIEVTVAPNGKILEAPEETK
jgi:uncharacterized membrane protein YkoI